MATPTVREQLTVDLTEHLAWSVFQVMVSVDAGRGLPRLPVREIDVAPGVVVRIDFHQWWQAHPSAHVDLNRELLHEARRYPWWRNLGNARQAPSQQPLLLRRDITHPSAPTNFAQQRDVPFHQAVQQVHPAHQDGSGRAIHHIQGHSVDQVPRQQPQGPALAPIRGPSLPPTRVRTLPTIQNLILPTMQVSSSLPTEATPAREGESQQTRDSTGLATPPRPQAPTPASAQASAPSTTRTRGRAELDDDSPVWDTFHRDISLGRLPSRLEDSPLQQIAAAERLARQEGAVQGHRASGMSMSQERRERLQASRERLRARHGENTTAAVFNERDRMIREGRSDLLPPMGRERASSLPPQPSPTFAPGANVSEVEGSSTAPDNGRLRTRPHSLTLTGTSLGVPILLDEEASDRHDDAESTGPASVRGSTSQGQTVLARHRRVTDPSPRTNAAMNLMRLHRPSHLGSTAGTDESAMDLRSASPWKAEGGEEWHGGYRDRQTRSGKGF